MTSPDQLKPGADIRSQAIEWLIRLADEDAGAQDYAAWMTWMEKDKQHRIAFDRASSIWGAIADMHQLSAPADPDHGNKKRRFKLFPNQWRHNKSGWKLYWIMSSIGTAAVVFMIAFLVDMRGYFGVHEQVFSTDIAEIREEVLPDHSTIVLGAQTKVKVSYNHDRRHIALLTGEAYFSIREDPQRPLYVTASHLSVTVVGTEFEIDKRTNGIDVVVLEGKVHVSANAKNNFLQYPHNDINKVLHKGEQITSDTEGILGPVKRVSVTALAAAWRSGLLLYEDALLKDVIADTNRYYTNKIILSPESLGDLPITASFKTDNIEQILRSLDEVLPIDIIRKKNGVVLLVEESDK